MEIEIDCVTEQSITHTQAAPTTSTLNILADRERKSRNLIVYNLSESSDPKADMPKIKELFTLSLVLMLTCLELVALVVRMSPKQDCCWLLLMICLPEAH